MNRAPWELPLGPTYYNHSSLRWIPEKRLPNTKGNIPSSLGK